MAIKVKREDFLNLNENFDNYFSLPVDIDLPNEKDEYEELKNKIYNLKIDKEEKANIINKISSLKTKSDFEKSKIIKEINNFKEKYNI